MSLEAWLPESWIHFIIRMGNDMNVAKQRGDGQLHIIYGNIPLRVDVMSCNKVSTI